MGFSAFHALDYTALLVILGVSIAYWRRWQDRAVKPQQRVLFDLLPLHLLMAPAAAITSSTIGSRGANRLLRMNKTKDAAP